MKARKILALLLAVLMVLGAMPLAFLAVSADGTGISAPTTLPDGETYIGTEFLLDSYDILAAYQAKKGVEGATDVTNMGWIGANLLGAGASDAVHRGAEGIMFKIDATNATVDSNVLELVIVIQISYKDAATGKNTSTYIVSNPTMAAAYSEAVCPDDAVSTWYYTLDGQDWTEMTAAKGTSRHSVPVGKGGEAYVYIPFDSFYTKCGESFLETGVADKTENVVPWAEAKPYFGTDFTFQMTNYYYTGDFKDNKTLAQDPAVKISEWRVVTHGTPGTNPGALPSELPTADGAFHSIQISDNFVVSESLSTANKWWADSKLTSVTDKTSWSGSAGLIFKFDGRNAAGTDAFKIAFELALYSDNGNTYLLSDPNLAKAHGGVAADTANTSSTWYVCTDGVNWTPVTHNWVSTYATAAPLTAERTAGYVFIPLDQFQSKGLSTDANKTMQNGADTLAAMSAGGKTVTLGDVKVRAEGAATDAGFSISEIGFVYMGESTEGTSTTPPSKLPDTNEEYKGIDLATKDITAAAGENNSGWMIPSFTEEGAQNLENAHGILLKMENGVASASPTKFSFAINAVGNNGVTTYVCSDVRMSMAYQNTTFEGKKTVTWYYSTDGKTWSSVSQESTAADVNSASIPISGIKGTTWVYIPVSALHMRHGATKLSGGADQKDPTLTFAEATEIVGGWKEFNMICVWFNNSTTTLSDLKIVTDADFTSGSGSGSGAESAPSTLPTTGGEYTFTEMNPGYTFQHNTEKPWDGYWYMSSDPVATKLNKDNIPADWMYSEGIMLKFDASNAPAGTDLLGMMVELAIGSDKGSTYLLSDPNMVAGYGNTKSGATRKLPASVLKTATSTWYYSVDGLTWQAAVRGIEAGTSPVVSLTNARTTGYVFIPMSAFWSYGIDYGDFADGQGMTAYEAFDILGKATKIGDIKLRLANNDISNNCIITEFGFVKSTKLMFDQSVSVTDDMNWNIFTSLPAGYTNASLTFTMGSKTLTPKAVDMGNNISKYTFEDISFADISTPITATFTAKNASGATVTETYTTTMEAYLRAVYGDSSALVFKELAISMLHYGAAVQKVTGYTGTYCNANVPANEVPQTANRFANTTWINPAPSIWGGAEFALNGGALTIKLAVNVPEGYTHIRYQTAGRLATVEIKDGYAYIPVYAYEYRDAIGLNYYKRGLASSDNTAAVSFTHVLKNAVANATEDERAMFDAMVTFMNEARVYKR